MSTDPKKWAGKKLGIDDSHSPDDELTDEGVDEYRPRMVEREASGEGITQDEADEMLEFFDDSIDDEDE